MPVGGAAVMSRCRSWGLVALVAALLAACTQGAGVTEEVERGPYDSAAEVDATKVEAEPSEVVPGGEVELVFPEETGRGHAYTLERLVDGQWDYRWVLTSDRSTVYGPARVPDDQVDWDDIAVTDRGPDTVQLPEELEPGEYRLCTEAAQVCVELSIVEP